ncbi:hypothetical protein BDZ97DRAFT_1925493 [Flammula alnicola]|nr:hypothetical protein BDZ97DRAFT_1925493 [Flammula alnicola]
MSPKGGSTSTSMSNTGGHGQGQNGTDWVDMSLQGSAVMLALVTEAANFAPVPFLRQAAGTTLQIVKTVQAVKDNKAGFRRLAEDATGLIAAVWQSYQASSDKTNWPPPELRVVIEDLVQTLSSIEKFVTSQVARKGPKRVIYSMADPGKIQEYRWRLGAAVSKFEELNKVSSHLNINDILHQVLKKQNEISEQLSKKGIIVEQTDAEKVLSKLGALGLDDNEGSEKGEHAAQSSQVKVQEVEAVESLPNLQSEPKIEPHRIIHVEATYSQQELMLQPGEVLGDVVSAAERYKKSEKDYLAKSDKKTTKAKQSKPIQPTPGSSSRRASVESEDDDDDDDDEETAVDEEEDYTESEDDAVEQARLAALAALAAQRKASKKKKTPRLPESAPMGQSPPMGGPGSQSPPMYQTPHPSAYAPYAPFTPPYYAYGAGSPPPHYPAQPMMGMYPGYYGHPASSYGASPPGVTNINSGNVSNVNMSNMNNDNSVKYFNAPPRRKKRAARS